MLKLNHLFPMKRHRKNLPTSIKIIIITWLSTIKLQKLKFYWYLYYHSDVLLLSIEGPQHDQIPPSYYGSPFPLIYHNLFKIRIKYKLWKTHTVKWYLLYNYTSDKHWNKSVNSFDSKNICGHLLQSTKIDKILLFVEHIHVLWDYIIYTII